MLPDKRLQVESVGSRVYTSGVTLMSDIGMSYPVDVCEVLHAWETQRQHTAL